MFSCVIAIKRATVNTYLFFIMSLYMFSYLYIVNGAYDIEYEILITAFKGRLGMCVSVGQDNYDFYTSDSSRFETLPFTALVNHS